MIHIEQNQNIPENDNIKVFSQTGDYEDNTLIEFYDIKNPEIATGAFAAQFIKYGSLVYKFNDPTELGEEILKIDPESTHTSASYVRMQKELLKQMNNGNLEPQSLSEVMADEQKVMEDKIENPIINDRPIESNTSSDTTEFNNSTTTQNVIEPVIKETNNSNPTLIEDLTMPTSSEPLIENTTMPTSSEPLAETPIIDTVIPTSENNTIIPELPTDTIIEETAPESIISRLTRKNRKKIV